MEETKELITTDDIRSKVYIIRGQQVMFCLLYTSGEQLLQGNGSVSHKQAVDKATDEYKKYKARTLSTVEEDYLNSIKILEKKTDKKQ